MNIEHIKDGDVDLALIVRRQYQTDGIEFFTPDTYSQQLGYMNRPAGYVIQPHIHRPVTRQVEYTNEVLFIRKGRVQVNFYTEQQEYLLSRELVAGDIILLIRGGHGFEMLEETEMFEVKQGPFAGDMDKVRFDPC